MRVIKHKIKAIKFDLEGLVEHREETEIEEEVQTPLEQLDPQLNSAKKFVESQRNELRQSYERLAILEALLDDLAKNYNPNFNDPVVKAAVQDFQNYASNNQVVEEETVLSLSNPSEEFNRIIEEFESGLNSIEVGTSAQEDSAETTECSIRKAFNQKFENFIEKLIASPKREKPQKYTRGKLDSEIEEKEKEIAKLEKERSELEYDLTDPKYGPDGILRSYNGHCLTKKIGDYDYKFCFTGSVNQIGAGQSVLIGSMDKVEVQEDHSLKIFFEHGARCWNGPIRKAVAHVECGAKDDILFTSEPEKCEYFFKVVSPIACKEIPNSKLKKDEL
ncbi:unnamed protein product [Kuraishia capsulata CBS 1993]|uniref:MRH domain-containing protein n=1 Tax=Kuraishia capsulata CBS 1993 TaxID=1382522 RepID=W6MKC2_9ASCO|nr:uncharacterized protein KUCA_T00002770001 [Kuraishia capsulata CBS 1993]CDK26796.1 unnamed protein product [Kuraishia capsulata CBS 1993]